MLCYWAMYRVCVYVYSLCPCLQSVSMYIVCVYVYSLCLLRNVILMFNFLISSGLCYQNINYRHISIAFAITMRIVQMIYKILKKPTSIPKTFHINSPIRHIRNQLISADQRTQNTTAPFMSRFISFNDFMYLYILMVCYI